MHAWCLTKYMLACLPWVLHLCSSACSSQPRFSNDVSYLFPSLTYIKRKKSLHQVRKHYFALIKYKISAVAFINTFCTLRCKIFAEPKYHDITEFKDCWMERLNRALTIMNNAPAFILHIILIPCLKKNL